MRMPANTSRMGLNSVMATSPARIMMARIAMAPRVRAISLYRRLLSWPYQYTSHLAVARGGGSRVRWILIAST